MQVEKITRGYTLIQSPHQVERTHPPTHTTTTPELELHPGTQKLLNLRELLPDHFPKNLRVLEIQALQGTQITGAEVPFDRAHAWKLTQFVIDASVIKETRASRLLIRLGAADNQRFALEIPVTIIEPLIPPLPKSDHSAAEYREATQVSPIPEVIVNQVGSEAIKRAQPFFTQVEAAGKQSDWYIYLEEFAAYLEKQYAIDRITWRTMLHEKPQLLEELHQRFLAHSIYATSFRYSATHDWQVEIGAEVRSYLQSQHGKKWMQPLLSKQALQERRASLAVTPAPTPST